VPAGTVRFTWAIPVIIFNAGDWSGGSEEIEVVMGRWRYKRYEFMMVLGCSKWDCGVGGWTWADK
jgi:hypothetical protein